MKFLRIFFRASIAIQCLSILALSEVALSSNCRDVVGDMLAFEGPLVISHHTNRVTSAKANKDTGTQDAQAKTLTPAARAGNTGSESAVVVKASTQTNVGVDQKQALDHNGRQLTFVRPFVIPDVMSQYEVADLLVQRGVSVPDTQFHGIDDNDTVRARRREMPKAVRSLIGRNQRVIVKIAEEDASTSYAMVVFDASYIDPETEKEWLIMRVQHPTGVFEETFWVRPISSITGLMGIESTNPKDLTPFELQQARLHGGDRSLLNRVVIHRLSGRQFLIIAISQTNAGPVLITRPLWSTYGEELAPEVVRLSDVEAPPKPAKPPVKKKRRP